MSGGNSNDYIVLRKMIYLQYSFSFYEIFNGMIDNKILQQFLVLSESLHFGKASQAAHVSPSTLSRSIQQLEQQLGCELFLRDNRSVELTNEGLKFQQFARENLQQWQQLQESLSQDKQQLQGTISIYCSVTASYSFLHKVLMKFRAEYPRIEIILHTGDTDNAISRVLNDQEDVAIAAKPAVLPPVLAFERLGQTSLVMIAPESVTFQAQFNIHQITKWDKQDWQQVPMILPERGVFRETFESWLNESKIAPNIYAQVGGNEAIVSMVSLGFGIGIVPSIVVENSPLEDQVKVISSQPNFKPIEIGFCVRKKRLQSPLVKALWQSVAR